MKKFDAIIIGSGQAGNPLAKKLAKAGWSTALIEKRKIGGTCVNDGCTPTKTMIAAARLNYLAEKVQAFGVPTDPSQIRLSKVVDRKNEVVSKSIASLEKSVRETENLTYVEGTAAFTGPHTLTVNGIPYTADHIFINTGASPVIPDIPGLKDAQYYTSTTILDIRETPEHLLIIGSGYIAMEMGQMYRRFGSKVTILEKQSMILSKEDDDVTAEIMKFMQEDGIAFHMDAAVNEVSRTLDGQIQVSLTVKGAEKKITCSHLLVAAGRSPNSGELNLAAAGVETDERGHIKVNDRLETNVDGIFALGDVKGGPAFTHISYNDHLVVARNLIDKKNYSIENRLVPYCMFTDPELGRIGMTEKEARKKGINIKVATLPMTRVARGVETGETRGLMKAVVNADTKEILGAAILSVSGGEIMSVLQLAMMGKINYEQIRENIFAHPTFSESLNNLFLSLEND